MGRRRSQPRLGGRRSGGVLLVSDVVAPGDWAARVVDLLHGEVGHEAVRRGAVPVVLAGLEEDAVYVDTNSGEFATHDQLREHELLDRDGRAQAPWHRVQAISAASTLWYALMRKRTHAIWLGALVMRSADHYRKLLGEGWEEASPERCGASLDGAPTGLAPTPFDAE